jgi:hypothetical protein
MSFGVAAFAARPSNPASGEVTAKREKSLRFNMFNPPRTGAPIAAGKTPDTSVHASLPPPWRPSMRAALLRLRELAAVIREFAG